jgi:uncharacterized protein (TIGR00369 family)
MSALIQRLWELGPTMVDGTPHAQMLGMKFVAVDKGRATLSLPYNTALIGDPRTRVISGGAVTTLLDQACGLAAIAGFDALGPVATLSLRIDYQRAATPGQTVIAEAICYKTTRSVAFIRATAHDGDPDDPVATAQAAFMVTGKQYPVPETST